MALAWQLEVHSTQALILVALADHAQDDGTGAYPSMEYLAYKTNLTERSIQRHMRELETAGIIEVVGNWQGGRGRKREYLLHLEKGDRKPPFEDWLRVTNRRPLETEKDDNLSPFEDVKGDIDDMERVTSCRQKGDILSPPIEESLNRQINRQVEPRPARANQPVHFLGPRDETVMVVVVAFFKSKGTDIDDLTDAYLADQHRAAASMLNQGYPPDDIVRCGAFMASQTWRTNPFDLTDVRAVIGKWAADGKPARERSRTDRRPRGADTIDAARELFDEAESDHAGR